MFTIRPDDLSDPRTRALVALHLEAMRAASPPGSVYALDPAGLRAPDVTVWTAWRGPDIAGMAALKRLDDRRGELKSMRTHPAFLRQGVARALLGHILAVARDLGLDGISLETGSGAAFDAALTLYRRSGFAPAEPFAGYERSAFNQFLHLAL